MMPEYFLLSLSSYLIGSIPFGYLLVRLFLKEDIRSTGSGNIGATNVARSGAKGLAIATLLLDTGKGFAAVSLAAFFLLHLHPGRSIALSQYQLLLASTLAALSAVGGHCFPVWLRFKGGKGVATALGVFFALAPKAILIALAVFLAVLLLTRYVSLGSILAAMVLPVALYLLDPEYHRIGPFLLATGVPLIVILKHHANIRRLVSGSELRFGANTA